jgi:hypothetical protein
VLWAQGRCGFDGVMGCGHHGLGEDDGAADPAGVGAGHRRRGLGSIAGCTASWARGGRHCCGLRNNVMGLGTRPALSTTALAQVGEDGSA